MTKREAGILIIIFSIVATVIGAFVLEAGIAVDMDVGGGAADTYVLIGIIVALVGIAGIIFGVRTKNSSAGEKGDRYEKALECISNTELDKLKQELSDGMITEEQFRQLVIQKSRKK